MRIQKNPAPGTLAMVWKDGVTLPQGVVVEEMTEAAFKAWLGAQPRPDPEPASVPCHLWRVRTLCTRRGKDAAVTAGIATLTAAQQQVANARWTYGGEPLECNEWFVKNLRIWLGYTNPQMDAFFAACNEL